jgi:hypothetical protein
MMRITMKKRKDGGAALTCTRADGSVTWQRHEGKNAAFFPVHDLTHFAVETTLRHTRGFYGLLAEGWNISDFGTPWPRGPMPQDALPSELIVGFLDAERAAGMRWSALELDEKAASYFADHGIDPVWTPINEDDLWRVRAAASQLTARWHELNEDETLELTFDEATMDR